jgi:four helix bundle protein
MHNFKELLVWQKSRILVKDVYELMASLPNTEKYGIISQIQRAVISIPANIAEGSGRGSNRVFPGFWTLQLLRLLNWKRK